MCLSLRGASHPDVGTVGNMDGTCQANMMKKFTLEPLWAWQHMYWRDDSVEVLREPHVSFGVEGES